MLAQPEHLDHMLYKMKKNVLALEQKIEEQTKNNPSFESMLIESTFSLNPNLYSHLASLSNLNYNNFCPILHHCI